jgi:DNA-binding NtrC family response regulator
VPGSTAPVQVHFPRGQGKAVDPGALALLEGHSWPGSARELRQAIERGCWLSAGPVVEAAAVARVLALIGDCGR